ncbi:hypothetical protein JB92DRAFT_3111289 [Gautieria morchelliformis]|nr:hypothetical protein JB92DRAFT_3111289 [Gautieria morchelliformis]
MFVNTWFILLCALLFVKGAPSGSITSDAAGLDPDSLLTLNLVKQINAFITLESLTTNLISINFDVNNPLPLLPLVIQRIKSNAGVDGTIFATFDHTFSPPFTINPQQTANSGTIPNVNLTQGALASLGIIPLGMLNLDSNITLLELIPIPINGLKQSGVPTM